MTRISNYMMDNKSITITLTECARDAQSQVFGILKKWLLTLASNSQLFNFDQISTNLNFKTREEVPLLFWGGLRFNNLDRFLIDLKISLHVVWFSWSVQGKWRELPCSVTTFPTFFLSLSHRYFFNSHL